MNKPYQMTNRCPENRHGTRTAIGYLMHCLGGNVPQARTVARATPRQDKKARKLFDAGVRPAQAQGRVIRACMRTCAAFYDDPMSDHYGFHP